MKLSWQITQLGTAVSFEFHEPSSATQYGATDADVRDNDRVSANDSIPIKGARSCIVVSPCSSELCS